ncbi:MAG TPA: DUF4965 domain-containing protein [Polyangiaceae bacterium]|jgi:hypothetical protein
MRRSFAFFASSVSIGFLVGTQACGSSGGSAADEDSGTTAPPASEAGTPNPGDATVPTPPVHDGGPVANGDAASLPDAGQGETSTGALDAGPDVDTRWTGRPPAAPLIVRNPYLSVWSPADASNGAWSSHWNGSVKAFTGIARIDGTAYVFLGVPTGIGATTAMSLVQRAMTPTKTEYVYGGGGVELTVDFLSPVEVGDLKRQSEPLGYVGARARAADGKTHAVSLYFDISGEWAHGDSTQQINWARETVPHSGGTLTVQSVTPASPQPLVEVNEYPAWGTAFLAADGPGQTVQIGQDTVVRGRAVSQGSLDGSNDTRMPRAINDAWPVLGFAFDLGMVGASASAPVSLVAGHARDPAVSYLSAPVSPLWKSYWSTWEAMVADAYDDGPAASSRAAALDARIVSDALAAGGASYSALCTLALRQAFGGTELVGTTTKPWLMLKEISSDGNVSTVDVVYPASPAFLYTNPYLLKLLLDPLLEYAETGGWPKAFAEHDLGSAYPNAAGHNDGNEEDMPIEESADMLHMMAAYAQRAAPADAKAYALAHYKIAKQWADYLVPNTLDPVNQNQTDDFTGFINHSANLALKGIVGVGAMGVLAQAAGNSADAASYASQAQSLIAKWAALAEDDGGAAHTLLEYDQSGTWSLKYNALYDRILGLGLVPASVIQQETAWYASKANPVGVPLDPRHTYTKTDWQLWTAGAIDDQAMRTTFINAVYAFATTSTARVPFSDFYDTVSGQQVGFMARPVAGGMFSLLARQGASIVPQ